MYFLINSSGGEKMKDSVSRVGNEMQVRKRNGEIAIFDPLRIETAIRKAFCAELGLSQEKGLPEEDENQVLLVTEQVVGRVKEAAARDNGVDVERIQDVVELMLMRNEHFSVARRYIVYREERSRARALKTKETPDLGERVARFSIAMPDGENVSLDPARLRASIEWAARDIEDNISVDELLDEVSRQLYDGITLEELRKATVLSARTRIEYEPDYDLVACRLLLGAIYTETLGENPDPENFDKVYRKQFTAYIAEGIASERLNPELQEFDLKRLAVALRPERDEAFPYIGLQTIYDRYLIHIADRRIETPQYFWMRVAMGLAIREIDREERTIEFYETLSSFRFVSSTPTLFNSGTCHPQMSSCYLSTVNDDLEHIFKVVRDDACLSKWSGGLGNDWTNIRATNAYIKGTNGRSQGVIPFLKVINDTAVAVNQGGKRKGAVCCYLETWHLDIEEFLDLRKNTGDDRRRTHDMHTANWIPDLFMKRVEEGGQWTLFSPDEVPDLHDLFGKWFNERYEQYEKLADEGKMKLFKRFPAVELWRRMLTRLFETGHPWITFKDPSNIRSPQDHTGVVHSSNLCTEILLNTSIDETAVCNLGSINMKLHLRDGDLDLELLEKTVNTAMRMLDNVIDINFYPTEEARRANQSHRPVGLGMMGFQDALFKLGASYASEAAMEFADRSMEAISYFAILASARLAAERGTYSSYRGSKWERGYLPIDTLNLLETERGVSVQVDRKMTLDWKKAREAVADHGMRNSNTMAIAPTATISQIVGCTQSIEPTYKNLFVRSNLSGDFTTINRMLVGELKALGLWDRDMLDQLKYYDGSTLEIERIPEEIRVRYRTAFEIEPYWLIEAAARRQKWIDMGQSLNLYMKDPSGRKLDEMYRLAWNKGLKTTYYLRTLAATQVEKSTLDVNKYGIQPRWMKNRSASSEITVARMENAAETTIPDTENVAAGQVCSMEPDCEACQ